MGKLILFLVVVCLISLVLYLSYKLDKKDEVENRNKKDNYKKDDDLDDEILTQNIMNNYLDLIDETDLVEENNYDVLTNNEEYTEEIILDNKVEEEIVDKEDIYYNDENLDELTTIFNSKLMKATDDILSDDDMELLDLQNEIASANVKKYTRKKQSSKLQSKKKEDKKETPKKRYTRKKDKKKENTQKSNNVKRYTRKKESVFSIREYKYNLNTFVENDTEFYSDDIPETTKPEKPLYERPKLKRGRPKKSDKPKRGRPKKVQPPKKRGRPRKEDKPKRGRPKKNANK